ncbi:2Fe-2S iron-sulfur cluster-binding protein [Streptomyces sp. NPDC088729]|uniref:2Fe-2S iron-sulfur cluster-binding protein n=1 Tax=Streptomyces sp. NPDC088729 TaxID=3365876 RepID=UPI00382505AD
MEATTPPSDEGNAMAKITYKQPDGTATVVDVHPPDTVMRGARLNGIDGIEAQCGGAAQCGTCHVYVDATNSLPLPGIDEIEDDVLYTTASPRTEHSRLSCQLPVSEEMDGLVVHLPESQV